MIPLLQNIIFTNPWILAGMAALPAIWLLLRIMPPAPKRITLPTTRFLAGLVPEEQTPSHTPLWILLLRLLIAALVILALAGPVYNPGTSIDKNTNVIRVVIDNDWAAAQGWQKQMEAASDILNQAARHNIPVHLVTTTPTSANESLMQGPMPATEALSVLRGLKPNPWAADYRLVLKNIQDNQAKDSISTFWLGHGTGNTHGTALLRQLQKQGPTEYIAPDDKDLPLILRQGMSAEGPAVEVMAPYDSQNNRPVSILAIDKNARVLDRQKTTLNAKNMSQTVIFDVPQDIRNQITQFRIQGTRSAGTTLLLDHRFHHKTIGIAAVSDDTTSAPLVDAAYYLDRALGPYADLHFATIDTLLNDVQPAMIILPDIGGMPIQTLNKLQDWIKQGGMLLRFAGPNMAQTQGETELTPVPLRRGGRALDGSMTWEKPLTLAPFPDTSPLYGIEQSQPATVRQQILPEPTQDLDKKVWARLQDGTPLITADTLDKGLLVMIHTTATPEWSDLALSGAYVHILRRMISMAGSGLNIARNEQTQKYLQPLLVLDGFGATRQPKPEHSPIDMAKLSELKFGPTHPPGIYGQPGTERAFNLGDHIDPPQKIIIPASVKQSVYGGEAERNLMPYLLLSALCLLLIDWLVMVVISTGFAARLRLAACLIPAALVLLSTPSYAQPADDLAYADGFYLAYMRTGNAAVDATSKRGLESLAMALARRTSAEPDGVIGLNPEHNTLVFFPLIYWPVTTDQKTLSEKALNNVQSYLDHGGTILFDTRDQHYAVTSSGGTKNTAALRQIMRGLNVPPLAPIQKDHVLGRTFYLLNSFPGRHQNGTLWVEQNQQNTHDGVSSIIIGGHDWAGAWAETRSGGNTRQNELATRFGVNLVMYALTGNYKADQVHVPHILERLDQ